MRGRSAGDSGHRMSPLRGKAPCGFVTAPGAQPEQHRLRPVLSNVFRHRSDCHGMPRNPWKWRNTRAIASCARRCRRTPSPPEHQRHGKGDARPDYGCYTQQYDRRAPSGSHDLKPSPQNASRREAPESPRRRNAWTLPHAAHQLRPVPTFRYRYTSRALPGPFGRHASVPVSSQAWPRVP